jgi:type IV pilus assembly protein PilC
MLYQFTLVSSDGKRKTTTLEADNIDRLRSIVQKDGNLAINIKEAGSLSKEVDFSRVTIKDLALFCQQMTSILKAGVPTVDALEMVIGTTKKKKLKNAISICCENIRSGITMSQAFSEFPKIFPLIMCQMIKAGEESGALDEIFYRLSIQFEKSYKLHNTIKKALAYPKMIIVVVIIALIVVCAVVVPMFVDIFNDLGTELPFTTKMFMALSSLFTTYWWLALIIAIVLISSFIAFKRSKFGSECLDKLKLKLPLIKNLEIKAASANLARTLSTLLDSGLDYPKALEIARDTMSNSVFRDGVDEIRTNVINGMTLTQALKKTKLFPELLENLLQIGENTGNIEEMLNNSAVYFEEEVETATLQLTTAIQPMIIVIMGVFVGALVYSIYTPMFSLYASIGK